MDRAIFKLSGYNFLQFWIFDTLPFTTYMSILNDENVIFIKPTLSNGRAQTTLAQYYVCEKICGDLDLWKKLCEISKIQLNFLSITFILFFPEFAYLESLEKILEISSNFVLKVIQWRLEQTCRLLINCNQCMCHFGFRVGKMSPKGASKRWTQV